MKAQIAAVNFFAAPFAVRNFKSAVAVGACSQSRRNCPSVPPFSGDQMADNCAASPASAGPKAFAAAVLAHKIAPLALTSNAGHAAPSKPNTTSGFTIQSNPARQVTILSRKFKER